MDSRIKGKRSQAAVPVLARFSIHDECNLLADIFHLMVCTYLISKTISTIPCMSSKMSQKVNTLQYLEQSILRLKGLFILLKIVIISFVIIKSFAVRLYSWNIRPKRPRVWPSRQNIQRVVLDKVFPSYCGRPLKN